MKYSVGVCTESSQVNLILVCITCGVHKHTCKSQIELVEICRSVLQLMKKLFVHLLVINVFVKFTLFV
jgi:Na+-translocating ferredoxin:NAD+ oxidoreductase RnfC subunit